jgi:hypothetical protein
MPFELIIREGEGPERQQLVPKETAFLGRREDNDVVLPFSFVSARHGRVFRRGAQVHVEDMGSTNGTLVNGVPLEPMVPRPLAPDDLVEIDRLALRVRWLEEEDAGQAAATYHEMAAPKALIVPARVVTTPSSAPRVLASAPPLPSAAPAGVWEIQAGAREAPTEAPAFPVLAPAGEAAGAPIETERFAPSRTLSRVPPADATGRFRLWSLFLRALGLLALLGAVTLLLFVLLA